MATVLISYQHKDSYFHKINPLAKFIIVVCVVILTFFLTNFVHNLILLSLIIPIAIKSKVLRIVFTPVKELYIIFVILFFIQGLFNPFATEKLFDLPFGFAVYLDGIIYAAEVAARLLVMMVYGYWFVLCTHPGDLVSSLKKIGLPHAIGYIMLTTLQIIPRVQAQVKTIIDAQKSRGLDTSGNLIKRVKGYLPLLGPLFMGSVQQTVEKSMALEARAFSSDCKKTNYRKTIMKNKDKIIIALAITISIIGGILSWAL